MPNRIFRSETGFHPLEAFGSFGAFSKPGMAFWAAYARGSPSAAAAMPIDCINLRRDTRLVVAFKSFFISVLFCGLSQYFKTVNAQLNVVVKEERFNKDCCFTSLIQSAKRTSKSQNRPMKNASV